MKYYITESLKIHAVCDVKEFLHYNKFAVDVTHFPNIYDKFEKQNERQWSDLTERQRSALIICQGLSDKEIADLDAKIAFDIVAIENEDEKAEREQEELEDESFRAYENESLARLGGERQ